MFTPLRIPVPPILERAIGYDGEARWVAFYWGAGDEVYYDDGRVSATADWQPYLLFIRHHAVWPGLIGCDFGSSDAPARQYLLLDRTQRALYAAPARAAHQFLLQQWPQPTAEEVAQCTGLRAGDLARLSERFTAELEAVLTWEPAAKAGQPRVGERDALVSAELARQQRRSRDLAAWLSVLPDDGRAAALEAELARQLHEPVGNGEAGER
jgi:hypothetical protein